MHELSLAHDVLRVCAARLPAGDARLGRVRLAVGELSAVEPDLLRFAWEAVVMGTPHAESVLEVEWRPARQVCEACGDVPERAAGSWLRLCPHCGQPLKVEGGQELDVIDLTYETTDETTDETTIETTIETTSDLSCGASAAALDVAPTEPKARTS